MCVCVCAADPEAECYNHRGRDYRGLANTTLSGARCLPWNSDLLYDELHVGAAAASALKGLGEHAYCRCVLRFPLAAPRHPSTFGAKHEDFQHKFPGQFHVAARWRKKGNGAPVSHLAVS